MKNKLTNNFVLKFIALLFSALLWLIVMNISRPIVTKTFYPEITVANPEVVTEHGQTFKIADDVKQIAVTVKAERSIMEKIKTEDIKAVADLKEEQSGSVPVRITIEGFEGDYKEALPNPRNIQIVKENIENKTFPVTAIATGDLQSGYVIGELEALDILDAWLDTEYEAGRHSISLELIGEAEEHLCQPIIPLQEDIFHDLNR